MTGCDTSETTNLLRAWAGGNSDAIERLTSRVYNELRRIAERYMRHETPGPTMRATALVHEAYLKLIRCERKGRPITFADPWIAAAAVQLDVPLVTNNAGDYNAVDGLPILTAAKAP